MIPKTMQAITLNGFGGPEVLTLSEVPTPVPAPGEVLISVTAVGFNRADVSQREGTYPPPPGASEILGLECSGIVVQAVEGGRFNVGDRVCALLSGGGYAEYVSVPEGQVLPVPQGIDLVDAAGIIEVASTVYSNFALGTLPGPHSSVLVHGGSGGLGTFAIMYATALGARVFSTAGSVQGVQHCIDQGAEEAWNYRAEDFSARVLEATNGAGVNLILDPVGGSYLEKNMECLALDGRLAIVATLGGPTTSIDLRQMMKKRITIHATTLRARPVAGPGSKTDIVQGVEQQVWPMIETGKIGMAPIFRMPFSEAQNLHQVHATGEIPPGKAVLVF